MNFIFFLCCMIYLGISFGEYHENVKSYFYLINTIPLKVAIIKDRYVIVYGDHNINKIKYQ